MRPLAVYLFAFFAVYGIATTPLRAQLRTEEALVIRIVTALQDQDSAAYTDLFPPFDTLWKLALMLPDTGVNGTEKGNTLRSHPEILQQYDPAYNPAIAQSFMALVKKGEDSGISWRHTIFMRYELKKMIWTRQNFSFEKLSPIRFLGYVFIKDALSRKTWAFTVSEIQQINGQWYGGQLVNIFEVETVDQFLEKQEAEARWLAAHPPGSEPPLGSSGNPDSTGHANEHNPDDEEDPVDIVDRKVFTGTFDNEINIILYIRYIKGNCPGSICSWQAIYKFGDQDEYINLDVSKTADGRWQFAEDPNIGNMELVLQGDEYVGTWTSSTDKTEYQVRLKETPVTPKRLFRLDKIIEGEEE